MAERENWVKLTYYTYSVLFIWFVWMLAPVIGVPAWLSFLLIVVSLVADYMTLIWSRKTYNNFPAGRTKGWILRFWLVVEFLIWVTLMVFTLSTMPAKIGVLIGGLIVINMLRWQSTYNLVNLK